MSRPPVSSRAAYYALAVLFTINLFNYIDRWIISGVSSLVGREMELSDTRLGSLGSAFTIVYTLASVPLGVLGDRARRTRVIAIGVLVWGAATFLSGLARSYLQLFIARALVGIGEAAYGPIATAMVSDYFPKARRAFVNALFTSAIPLGTALGMLLGGTVGSYLGWRKAFFLVGLPSLCLVPLAWRLREPTRGVSDVMAAGKNPSSLRRAAGPLTGEIIGLFKIPTFLMVCVVGMLVAFATGAFQFWLPAYLERIKHLPLDQAAVWSGTIQAFAGVLGVILGGLIGDALMRRTRAGHLLTIGGGFVLSAPLGLLFLLHSSAPVYLIALFFAIFFLVLYTGTVNAVIHNVVHPNLRATAISIFVLLLHLGGDAFSPLIVGLISGRRSLQGAMLILPVMVFFAGLLALAASGVVVGDMRRLEGRLAEGR